MMRIEKTMEMSFFAKDTCIIVTIPNKIELRDIFRTKCYWSVSIVKHFYKDNKYLGLIQTEYNSYDDSVKKIMTIENKKDGYKVFSI